MRLKVATVVAFIGVLVAQISAANAAVIYSNLGTPDSTTSVAIGEILSNVVF